MSDVRVFSLAVIVIGLGLLAQSADAGDPSEGAKLYGEFCVACHGATGGADGPAAALLKPKPRKLSSAAIMRTISDQAIFDMIKKGGMGVGKSPVMQSFDHLGDAKITALLAHVRHLCQCQYEPAAGP